MSFSALSFSSPRRLRIIAASAFIAAMASACAAPNFEADVTRFHTFSEAAFPDTIEGQTLLVEPLNPEASGLEFTRYADLVGNRLAAYGYQPASGQGSGGAPDVIARLAYSVSDTGAVDNGSGSRIGIGVGGSSGGHRGSGVGIGLGTSINLGGGPKPVFIRRMTLILIDRATGAHIFEGQATSRGRSPDLAHIMPMLVDALFDGFPGTSGATVRIRLDVAE